MMALELPGHNVSIHSSVLLVVMNKGEKARPMVLRFKNQVAKYEIAAHAITTFLF